MTVKKAPDAEYDEQEAAKRRDDALRRALNTPPKPHKPVKRQSKDVSRESRQRHFPEKA